jgi:hypothetical protein
VVGDDDVKCLARRVGFMSEERQQIEPVLVGGPERSGPEIHPGEGNRGLEPVDNVVLQPPGRCFREAAPAQGIWETCASTASWVAPRRPPSGTGASASRGERIACSLLRPSALLAEMATSSAARA